MHSDAVVMPHPDAVQCMQSILFEAMDVFWIPRRSAELKVAVKAMTATESLTYSWQHILSIFTYHTPKLRMTRLFAYINSGFG